jgi:hypothetical protein
MYQLAVYYQNSILLGCCAQDHVKSTYSRVHDAVKNWAIDSEDEASKHYAQTNSNRVQHPRRTEFSPAA